MKFNNEISKHVRTDYINHVVLDDNRTVFVNRVVNEVIVDDERRSKEYIDEITLEDYKNEISTTYYDGVMTHGTSNPFLEDIVNEFNSLSDVDKITSNDVDVDDDVKAVRDVMRDHEKTLKDYTVRTNELNKVNSTETTQFKVENKDDAKLYVDSYQYIKQIYGKKEGYDLKATIVYENNATLSVLKKIDSNKMELYVGKFLSSNHENTKELINLIKNYDNKIVYNYLLESSTNSDKKDFDKLIQELNEGFGEITEKMNEIETADNKLELPEYSWDEIKNEYEEMQEVYDDYCDDCES